MKNFLSITLVILVAVFGVEAQNLSGSSLVDTNNVTSTGYTQNSFVVCNNTPQWTKDPSSDDIYKCDPDGKVGIGVTAPEVKLDVAGGGGIRARGTGTYSSRQLTLSSNSSNQITATNNLFVASNWGAIILTPSSTHNYVLVQNADLRVHKDLKVDDNVGIGTTSPQAKLDVNGNSIINGNLNLSASQSHIYSANGPLNIQDGSLSNEDIIMADNTGGNVGIGFDAPQAKLHVDGEALFNEKVGIGTYNPEKMLHVRSTRAGGGQQQLLSGGTDDNGIRLEDRIATGVGNPDITTTWDIEPLASETSGESSLRIGLPNEPVITILENKNVGIGTTEPELPLHVELPDNTNYNAIRFEGKRSTLDGHAVNIELNAPNSPAPANETNFNIVNANPTSASDGNRLLIRSVDDNGNVVKELLSFSHDAATGLGTLNPESKFHVMGDGIFESNYGQIMLKSTGSNSSWSIQSHASTGDLYFRHDQGYDFYGDFKMGLAPDGTLKVGGSIQSCEVEVELNGWCDYVFDESYNLMELNELSDYINNNKHLPGVPSENELIEKGSLKVGKMQKIQMEKIEELTLYILDQNKKIELLMAKNEEMMSEINELKSKVE